VIKGDMKCSSIAAASVLAKTERDAMLVELATAYPEYGFEENKAYASPRHLDALVEYGPCEVHRRSWNLRGARQATSEDDELDELAGEVAV
jgi:ribonuclease HII